MKRTLIFCFILFFDKSFSQVKIEPFSIGVGQNTNTAIPLHINRSGEALRIQGIAPFLSFYNENNFSGYFQAINNTFEIGSKNNNPIHLYTNNVHRITLSGNSHFFGIGIINPTQALDVDGNIKFNGTLLPDNNQGNPGQFLESKGASTPVWTALNSNPKIGFQAERTSLIQISTSGMYNFTGMILQHQSGNQGFNTLNGEYLVPEDGFYHFDFNIPFFNSTLANINDGNINIYVRKNGLIIKKFGTDFNVLKPSDFLRKYVTGSFNLNLLKDDILTFELFHSNLEDSNITLSQYTFINGHKIY